VQPFIVGLFTDNPPARSNRFHTTYTGTFPPCGSEASSGSAPTASHHPAALSRAPATLLLLITAFKNVKEQNDINNQIKVFLIISINWRQVFFLAGFRPGASHEFGRCACFRLSKEKCPCADEIREYLIS
jgi:hypothetical protein